MPDTTTDILDMSAVLDMLTEIRDYAVKLDAAPLNVDLDNNKDRMRANAERSRDLLYAAHLADLTRAEILSQYHRFKGQNPPLIGT